MADAVRPSTTRILSAKLEIRFTIYAVSPAACAANSCPPEKFFTSSPGMTVLFAKMTTSEHIKVRIRMWLMRKSCFFICNITSFQNIILLLNNYLLPCCFLHIHVSTLNVNLLEVYEFIGMHIYIKWFNCTPGLAKLIWIHMFIATLKKCKQKMWKLS